MNKFKYLYVSIFQVSIENLNICGISIRRLIYSFLLRHLSSCMQLKCEFCGTEYKVSKEEIETELLKTV